MSKDDNGREPMGMGEKWLVDTTGQAVKQLHINQVVTATGSPGAGKSWGGLRLGELLDDDFSLDKVIFPGPTAALDAIKAIANEKMKFGSFILLDDLGLLVPARDFWTLINKGFGLVAQSSRYLRKIVWGTLPDQTFLDSQPRKLTHYHLEFVPRKVGDVYTRARTYEVQSNPRSGKIYFKHPPLGNNTFLEKIYVHPPSKELREAYEVAKWEKMRTFYDVLIGELETGKVLDDGYHSRMILLIEKYGSQLGKTDKQIAKEMGIDSTSLSRALKKARFKVKEIDMT